MPLVGLGRPLLTCSGRASSHTASMGYGDAVKVESQLLQQSPIRLQGGVGYVLPPSSVLCVWHGVEVWVMLGPLCFRDVGADAGVSVGGGVYDHRGSTPTYWVLCGIKMLLSPAVHIY